MKLRYRSSNQIQRSELKYGMETFLNTYPDADLLAINLLFDENSYNEE